MASFDPVTALTRGIEVLRVVNHLGEATITQIHRETGVHKSTVLRMLETLMHEGYVARQPNSAAYIPTGKCLLLSNGLRQANRLGEIASPILSAFRKGVGWPSDFALFDIDAMVIMVTSREFGVMSLNRKIGARAPMLVSSLGLAYLAFCTDAEREAILDRLAASDDPWAKDAKDRAKVRRVIAEVRERGYATTDFQYHETVYESTVWGIGLPVMVFGKVAGAVNIMFLRASMSLEDGVKTLYPQLRQAAADIGAAIQRDFGG